MDPSAETAPAPQKVLVVDDDSVMCKMMATALENGGYHTMMAASGEDCLALYEVWKPDLILLDVAMPGKNGLEVAAEIRKGEPPGTHTPIIIITAFGSTFLVSVDLQLGVDSYLTKPILPEELVDQVRTVLQS